MAQVRSREKPATPAASGAGREVAAEQAGGGAALNLIRRAPALSAIVVMALVGLGASIYLTVVHYDTKVSLVCTSGGLINCGNVTTSAYSFVPFTTIPVTIPGMLWFVVSGALALVGLRSIWQGRPEPARLRLAQVIWSLAGLLFVIYLIYCEIVLVHNICEWCTGVHILTFATFILAFYRLQRDGEEAAPLAMQAAPQTPTARPARQLARSRHARRIASGSRSGR